MPFDFLTRVERLTATNLTLRERARLGENPNDLRWRALFPLVRVNSTRISEFSPVDFRPAGGRREWDAQGREIPEQLGPQFNWEMIPINPTKHFNEFTLQRLRERALNPLGGLERNMVDAGIIAGVDEWATKLANAADVQIERDGFEAWFTGIVTVKDPKSDASVTVSLGYDAARYVQATATLAAETNAYDAFLGYAKYARTKLGSLGGVRLRQSLMDEILKDAPAADGDMATVDSLQARMAANGFSNFRFVVDERFYHEFTDGGSTTTPVYYVPEDRMAFQPAGGAVGVTNFAPVTRAWEYFDPSRINEVRDFTIFYDAENNGKTLLEEAQANAMALPAEQNVCVIYDLA